MQWSKCYDNGILWKMIISIFLEIFFTVTSPENEFFFPRRIIRTSRSFWTVKCFCHQFWWCMLVKDFFAHYAEPCGVGGFWFECHRRLTVLSVKLYFPTLGNAGSITLRDSNLFHLFGQIPNGLKNISIHNSKQERHLPSNIGGARDIS